MKYDLIICPFYLIQMLRGRAQLFMTNPRITMMKNLVSHILFLRKWGLIVHLAALKRGLFRPHIRTMSYIGCYPPPPSEHRNGAVIYPQCIKNLLIK